MAGILQLFDFSQASSSQQLVSTKRHHDGFAAPRNSLEFPIELWQTYELIHEDIPYSCQVKYDSATVNIHPHGCPIKKLIDDEMTNKTKDRHQRFNVITRLMGIDHLSEDPSIQPKLLKDEKTIRKKGIKVNSTQHFSNNSKHVRLPRKDQAHDCIERDYSKHNENIEMKRLRAREHSQEEVLQKFKKDFEAWQASKVWETSRAVKLINGSEQATDTNVLVLENLHRETTSRYIDTERSSSVKRTIDLRYHGSLSTLDTDGDGFTGKDREFLRSKGNVLDSRSYEYQLLKKSEDKSIISSSPRRIVILKPCSEFSENTEEFSLGSPDMFKKENNMHEFLEQVKERLKVEIQGNNSLDATTRWSGTDTMLTELPTHSKQIAYKIAKEIRESITKDYKTNLMRSESTRSYGSETQKYENKSPQFISKDTRRRLTDRMKNVLKNKTDTELSLSTKGRLTPKSTKELETFESFKQVKKVSYCEDWKGLNEMPTTTLEHDQLNCVSHEIDYVPPKTLLRSYSAPLSGTTFSKLFIEDKHALSAAHIHRKHELATLAGSIAVEKVKKNRKESFNIKSKLSSLRHSLLPNGKLFRRKSFSMNESTENDFPFINATMTKPSVILNSGFPQDNSTEVPPSPVSMCSTPHDEFFIPGYPSPISPLETPCDKDINSLQISADATANLCEFNHPEHSISSNITFTEKLVDDEAPETENDAKAFLRDILITSGLFEGKPFSQALAESETLMKPISRSVFNEVENLYKELGKLEYKTQLIFNDHIDIGPNMLFDLINEALQKVFRTPRPSSTTFNIWLLYHKRMLQGKQLLHKLLRQIQSLSKCPLNYAYLLENVVAQEIDKMPWSSAFHEHIDVIAMDIEVLVFQDIIDELVHDIEL